MDCRGDFQVVLQPRPLTTRLGAPELPPLAADRDAEAFAEHVVRGGEHLRAHLPWPDATRTPDDAQQWLAAYERREDGRVLAAGAWRGEALVGGGVLFNHDAEAAAVEFGVRS
jgi:hypothetical protein